MTSHLHQFSKLSDAEACEALAVLAVTNRRVREKAAGLGDVVKNLAQSADPAWATARHGLIGAGIGAGIGGLSSMSQPKNRRRTLSSMLNGALLGGVVGGGASLASRHFGVLGETQDSEVADRLKKLRLGVTTAVANNADPASVKAMQDEIAQLEPRHAALEAAKEQAALESGQPRNTSNPLNRMNAAAQNLMGGRPDVALSTIAQDPGEATVGAIGGGVGGYGAGVMTDKLMAKADNAATANARMSELGFEDVQKAVGKNNPQLNQIFDATRSTHTGSRDILDPHRASLSKINAKPVGRGFRRLLPIVGAFGGAAVTGGLDD